MDKSIECKIAYIVNGHTFPVVELIHISVGQPIPLLPIPVMSDERERPRTSATVTYMARVYPFHDSCRDCSFQTCALDKLQDLYFRRSGSRFDPNGHQRTTRCPGVR